MGDTTLRELVYVAKAPMLIPIACVEDISADVAQRTVADSSTPSNKLSNT
jgi:hypothetical protein